MLNTSQRFGTSSGFNAVTAAMNVTSYSGGRYEPLVASGLKIPSLRYVLERGIREHGVGSGDWTAFLRELARVLLARVVQIVKVKIVSR